MLSAKQEVQFLKSPCSTSRSGIYTRNVRRRFVKREVTSRSELGTRDNE